MNQAAITYSNVSWSILMNELHVIVLDLTMAVAISVPHIVIESKCAIELTFSRDSRLNEFRTFLQDMKELSLSFG